MVVITVYVESKVLKSFISTCFCVTPSNAQIIKRESELDIDQPSCLWSSLTSYVFPTL